MQFIVWTIYSYLLRYIILLLLPIPPTLIPCTLLPTLLECNLDKTFLGSAKGIECGLRSIYLFFSVVFLWCTEISIII